ncbi:MAG: hypothetical protein QGG36_01345 [Pirellulaceae bacterium]|nr:hypothetical protein [Pirellulaceae bacterium]MDP7014423.1 hypothetical protein [Pirellulaceae bacterium]
MIGPQHDHRVVGEGRTVERGQQPTDLVVDVRDAGKIRLDGRAPLLVLHNGCVAAGGDGLESPLLGDWTEVFEVLTLHLRKPAWIVLEAIEKPLGRPQRDVRPIVPDAEEERLAVEAVLGAWFAVGRHSIQRQDDGPSTTILENGARMEGAFRRQLVVCVLNVLLGKRTPPLLDAKVLAAK